MRRLSEGNGDRVKTLLIDTTPFVQPFIPEANGGTGCHANDGSTWRTVALGGRTSHLPGGRPDHERLRRCADAILRAHVPLLGVCLGHQGLGWIAGAQVVHAPEVMHGRLSAVIHEETPLFAGIPREFQAVRYHSLCVSQPLPDDLEPIAWTSDGVLMAVATVAAPWGVSSIRVDLHRARAPAPRELPRPHPRPPVGATRALRAGPHAVQVVEAAWRPEQRERLQLRVKRLDRLYDTERAFVHLYGSSQHAFWLDSSRVDERARFSFMGATGGPLSAFLTYDVGSKEVRVERGAGAEVHQETIFRYLTREMRRLRYLSDDLPFDFNCGFAGYLGYELKDDCAAISRTRPPDPTPRSSSPTGWSRSTTSSRRPTSCV